MSRRSHNPPSRFQDYLPSAVLDPVLDEAPKKPESPTTKVHVALSPSAASPPNFLTFDSTLSVITDNAGLVSLSGVKYDTRWLSQFTQLPLRPDQGYVRVLESNADVILENNQDDYGGKWIGDPCGPPSQSVWYSWWTSGPAKRSYTPLTPDTIEALLNSHDRIHCDMMNGKTELSFMLPFSDRQKLYNTLFAPVLVSVPEGGLRKIPQYIEDIIFSKLFMIFSIENFILMTLKLFKEFGADRLPCLEYFTEDVCHVLDKLLTTRFQMSKMNDQVRLDQPLWWLNVENSPFSLVWNERWSEIRQSEVITSPRIQRDYICALFDTLFGLWPAPGHCFLHTGSEVNIPDELDVHGVRTQNYWARARDAIPRCINTGLYFWEDLPAEPDVGNLEITKEDIEKGASISLMDLDAFLIERRLPFTFKATNRLDLHLTINVDREILIFPHWKRYLMLRHHRVLINDSSPEYPEDYITLFQLHSRSNRTANERVRGTGGDVRYIAYELLQTYALLFFRAVATKHRRSTSSQRRSSRSPPGYYYREAKVRYWPALKWLPKSPDDIIDRLGLRFDEKKTDSFMALMEDIWEGDYFPESRDFRFFGKRLEVLNRELNVWKPSTIREMLNFRGWVEEETNYWTLVISAFSVLVFASATLVLTCVLVYYAVHPNSPGS